MSHSTRRGTLMVYYLSRQELAQGLDNSLEVIHAILAQVREEDYARPTANPKWNVQDIIAHLAASAFGLLATAERFLQGGSLPSGFDLDYWNERQVEKRRGRTMPELLAEIRQGHEKAKALLVRLSDEDLRVRGPHPAGPEVSVAGVFHLIAQHEMGHMAEVAQALGVEFPYPVSWQDPLRKDHLWWRLEDVRREVKAFAMSLSPEEWHKPVYDEWALRDVIAHLAAAEKGHVEVGWRLLRGASTHLPDFDLDEYNRQAVNARRHLSPQELLAELDEARAQTARLLAAVGPEDWEKGGPHPGGFDVTVEGIFKVIALHERRHLKEMRQALEGG